LGQGTMVAQAVESTWLFERTWVWILCMSLLWQFN